MNPDSRRQGFFVPFDVGLMSCQFATVVVLM